MWLYPSLGIRGPPRVGFGELRKRRSKGASRKQARYVRQAPLLRPLEAISDVLSSMLTPVVYLLSRSQTFHNFAPLASS